MDGKTLETIVIEPPARPDAAIILMHGLGADGHDFESLVPELRLPGSPAVRWIFPHAPVRSVTLNDGFMMRAWYDLTSLDFQAPEDEQGIRESAAAIGGLIRGQRDQGISSERIVLAGFSQGGAMALFTALRWPERLAGVAALSCYLPLPALAGTESHAANSALPVFMAHGTQDPVVPFGLAEGSRDLLLSNGYILTWRAYPMQHAVCSEEVADLREWLLGALAGAP
jgi:phospholipase/carboxylesterase